MGLIRVVPQTIGYSDLSVHPVLLLCYTSVKDGYRAVTHRSSVYIKFRVPL